MASTVNSADDRVMSPLNLVVKLAPGKKSGVAENTAAVANAIKTGSDTIGTLHEARFVQLDDDTVMLLTTYDGDFDAYIFDFTKHLSQVFNMLLPNAIDPPPLPVEKNPQAFADWVRERDLPTLSAYYNANPDLTVQDVKALRSRG
ncbi:MAG: hypothetical protein M9947_18260 [Thermomicrobiales bacterium]|nr:hypothetical protein [Planctomycetales bacterium]MCO5223497.1 hypothetical protein [Thermomicrobiales bacterium]